MTEASMTAPAPLLEHLAALDRAAFHAVNVDGGALLDAAARALSAHAFGFAWGLALAAAIVLRSRAAAPRAVVALALAAAASDFLGDRLLRPLFDRTRPLYALPPDEVRRLLRAADAGSLPSLHASNFFALAAVATLADRRLGLAAYPVAVAVAWSRVYGGVHWPGDVLAGALWGTLAALGAWAATRPLAGRHGRRP
jgi:undecaprenyl-diphosphatase